MEQLRASAPSWQQQAEAAATKVDAGQEGAAQQAVEAAVQQAVQPWEQKVKALERKLEGQRQKAREAEHEVDALKKRAEDAEEGLARAQEALQVGFVFRLASCAFVRLGCGFWSAWRVASAVGMCLASDWQGGQGSPAGSVLQLA